MGNLNCVAKKLSPLVDPVTCADGLRHTSATLLLQTGASIKAVSMRLGHKSIEITLKHDAGVLATDQGRIAELAEMLFGADRDKFGTKGGE